VRPCAHLEPNIQPTNQPPTNPPAAVQINNNKFSREQTANVVKIENARLPRSECKFLSNNSFRWVHHPEGNYLARGAKKAVSWRTFSLRHQIHTHHFLSGRERIHPSRSWKSGAENALRDARAGNQLLLLLSRTRSRCIAREGRRQINLCLPFIYARAYIHICSTV
jgi:hypothetical protein